jgi:hypothetical protein
MHGNWKLALVSACALLLLLALGTRAGLHGRAGGRAPANELEAPAIVEVPELAQAPRATTAERRALADTDVAPAAESAHTEPTAASVAEGFSLRVTIRELGGAPLAPGGASVQVADERGQGYGTALDADGVALLTDLAPGRWWVRGSAPGRMTESREVHLPSSDAGLELELRLAPRPHVRILVQTPDGRPFAQALPDGRTPLSATASRRRPDGWLGDVLESPEWVDCGFFQMRTDTEPEPALLGRIELDCKPPLWVSLHLNEDVLESQLLAPGIDELRFVVDPDAYKSRFAEVVLRVVDADGAQPLQGVLGHLHTGPRHRYMIISKSESGLRFKGLMAGRARLELSASGYEARLLEFTLQPGEQKDLGDVELSRDGSGQLELHVRGGVGVSDLAVNWTTEVELRNRERGATMAQFSAPVEGEMLEIDLARGGWGVWASARRDGVELRSRMQLVAMEGGRIAVTLALEPVATLVLEPIGRPIDVWVQTPEGLLAHGTKLRLDDLPTRIALVPGSYTLLLREEGREDRVQQLHLPAEGATLAVD